MTLLTRRLLYVVYVSLLITLLPHTAWAFSKFEPGNLSGTIVAWAASFAFEAAIAALTIRLTKRIESTPRRLSGVGRWKYRYLNAYGGGLVLALGVSALANLAHAVEYGIEMAIIGKFGIPFGVYAVSFGGILPLVSLLFANVLSIESPEEEPEVKVIRKKEPQLLPSSEVPLLPENAQTASSSDASYACAICGDVFPTSMAKANHTRWKHKKEVVNV